MATKAQLESLSGEYRRAMRLVNQAGNILIDATDPLPINEITGPHGPTSSAWLISTLAEVSGGIYRAITMIERTAPTE